MAVIDTGVARHPRLPGLIAGGDYVSSGDGTEDCDAHGTLVAGLIAATEVDGQGFSGVAPEAQILTIRQTSRLYQKEGANRDKGPDALPQGYGTTRTMASAIRRAADMGATVINVSARGAGSGAAARPSCAECGLDRQRNHSGAARLGLARLVPDSPPIRCVRRRYMTPRYAPYGNPPARADRRIVLACTAY
ncbi:S8 family serine peptidase [Nocardia abscessus]|uniref:S8 family serine peptidase n=1 Tax=Nocardia abscessus TaxID=120957 RepID=UPI003981046E